MSEVSKDQYYTIYQLCLSLIKSNKTLGTREASQFPSIPYNTIQHIYRECYHNFVSEQESLIKQNIDKYIAIYKNDGSIMSIVQENSFYLPIFLRQFIKKLYKLDNITTARYIQNPKLISDSALSEIVASCDWGSVIEMENHDRIRQSSGLEYEYLLKEKLRNKNIPFRTEAEQREAGQAKTPDIVLDYPIYIKVNGYPLLMILFFS